MEVGIAAGIVNDTNKLWRGFFVDFDHRKSENANIAAIDSALSNAQQLIELVDTHQELRTTGVLDEVQRITQALEVLKHHVNHIQHKFAKSSSMLLAASGSNFESESLRLIAQTLQAATSNLKKRIQVAQVGFLVDKTKPGETGIYSVNTTLLGDANQAVEQVLGKGQGLMLFEAVKRLSKNPDENNSVYLTKEEYSSLPSSAQDPDNAPLQTDPEGMHLIYPPTSSENTPHTDVIQVYGQATVYGSATVHGTATVYSSHGHAHEESRTVQKDTSAFGDRRVDLLTGLYELPKPLQKALTPYLEDEIFRSEAVERFSQLQGNVKLQQESARDFLHSLGSFLGDDDAGLGTSDIDDLVAGSKSLPQPIQEAMTAYLENPRTRAQVQEQFARLQGDPKLQQEAAMELLDTLGLREEEEEKGDEGNDGKSPAKFSKGEGDLSTAAPPPGVGPSGQSGVGGTQQPADGDREGLAQDPVVEDQPPVLPLNHQEKFFDWKTFRNHPLDPTEDALENKYLATLALYDAVKVNVTAQSAGIGLEGIAKLFRHYCHKVDLLTFYRSTQREILLPLDEGEEVDRQRLEKLDINLFDTSKFIGSDRRLTSVTYGENKYGTITLFELQKAQDGKPKTIRPRAAMRRVPKIILENIAKGIQGASKTTLKMPHNEIWKATEQTKIGEWNAPVPKPDLKTIDNPGNYLIGNALKDALSMDDLPLSRVIATVPQMMAMLHHKTEVIEMIESTDVRRTLVEGGGLPWVRMVDGPEMNGHSHSGNDFKVIVLGPAGGRWVEEKLAWK